MMIRMLQISILLLTSCSYISGPEGLFPPTKDEFLKEKVEADIQLPLDLDFVVENHYPVDNSQELLDNQDKYKDTIQIFSSGKVKIPLNILYELFKLRKYNPEKSVAFSPFRYAN